jgi:hypothetical protein
MSPSVQICVETRLAPASLAATRRGFNFYVAHAIRSIHLWLKFSQADCAVAIANLKSPSALACFEREQR